MVNHDMILALKQFKKNRREQEIALYGHSINRPVVFKNKKKYSRKKKHKSEDY